MLDLDAYLVFLAVVFTVTVLPGPDHVYLGAVALRDGRVAGLIAAAGMAASMGVHTLVATTGLGVVLAAAPAALIAIRAVGAAYLVVLGAGALRAARRARAGSEELSATPGGRVFWRAALVNLTNPKIVLFFLAFLPQFVDADAGPAAGQLLLLGLSFVAVGFIVDSAYALLGGALHDYLDARGTRRAAIATANGVILLSLAGVIVGSIVVDTVAVPGPV
ncbi:LysE family translocator [Agromyces intestinalis]|nr:LysE family translocator [Agromyces intestinalis]